MQNKKVATLPSMFYIELSFPNIIIGYSWILIIIKLYFATAPLILILPPILGLNGLIFTQPVADVLSILLCSVFAIKINKDLMK